MATTIKIIEGVAVITLKGKLMGGPETEQCYHKIKDAISQGITNAAVDLSGADWINSRGLGILMACYVSMHNHGGELRLAGGTAKTRSLLKLTKLNTIFKTYETIDEALASFK